MSISHNIILRYRSAGHLRFDLPTALCQPSVAEQLIAELSQMTGVHRVEIYQRHCKLALHFDPACCDFTALLKHFHHCVDTLPVTEASAAAPAHRAQGSIRSVVSQHVNQNASAQWVKEKYLEAKETLTAMKIVAKVGMKKKSGLVKDPEKAIIDFLNDVLVLFLIRRFWPQITTLWVPHPLTYRYEWMTVFYLFYLLVRSRIPK